MQRFRKYVMTAQSFGTGGNDTLARMFIIWIQWLALVNKDNKEAANTFSKLIHFAFANTDQTSFDKARRTVRMAQDRYPEISVSTQFNLMDYHINPEDPKSLRLRGKGAPDKEIGEKAIEAFLNPTEDSGKPSIVRDLISESHLYLPIATLGSGNTGSTAILPVTVAANNDPECWVIPAVILSAEGDMNEASRKYQVKTRISLQKMPIWMLLSDNGYFTHSGGIWNNQSSMQSSYSRLDYLLMSSLRTLIMMLAHPTQIDRSKLENSIFSGPGGLLCVGGIDIDFNQPIQQEAKRAAHMLFDNSFALEYKKNEKYLGYDQKAKFDVAIIGIMGDFPAPMESELIKTIKTHPYLSTFLPEADMHYHRCGSYLPREAGTMFSLLARKRPGDPIELRYPPEDHSHIVALRDLETEMEEKLFVVQLGRDVKGDQLELPPAITKPEIPLVDFKSIQEEELPKKELPQHTSCLQFIEKEPERLSKILKTGIDLQIPIDGFGDFIRLMEFIDHLQFSDKDFVLAPESNVWVVSTFKSFKESRIPQQCTVGGMPYDATADPLPKLGSFLGQFKDKDMPIEKMPQERLQLVTVYLMRRVLGNQFNPSLIA